MNEEFATTGQQEECPFGTNLDFLRRNLAMTPEERLKRYIAGYEGWRKIIHGAARCRADQWRSQQSSNVSSAPAPATSS